MKKSQWQDVIDLNLTGVFLCTQVHIYFDLRELFHYRLYPIFTSRHSFAGCSQNNDEKEKGRSSLYYYFTV